MSETQFKHKQVMVIDDNHIDRYLCERVSQKYGFAEKVISMESARSALDYLISLKENPDQLPALIFLDINMPAMTGFDFLDEYNELPENIKQSCIIVMLTTSSNPDDKERASNNKYVKGYLSKPLNEDKIKKL